MSEKKYVLSDEDKKGWKQAFAKALEPDKLTIENVAGDFWARGFPLEEAIAIVEVQWPSNLTALKVRATYAEWDDRFDRDMKEENTMASYEEAQEIIAEQEKDNESDT